MVRAAVDLSCAACGSNRLHFPMTDEELVICEDCGSAGKSLHEVKVLMEGDASGRVQR